MIDVLLCVHLKYCVVRNYSSPERHSSAIGAVEMPWSRSSICPDKQVSYTRAHHTRYVEQAQGMRLDVGTVDSSIPPARIKSESRALETLFFDGRHAETSNFAA